MGIDLDTWRRKQKMSWDKLAKIVGLPITTVRRFALGMATIATERVDTILTVTHGEVDLYAMHRKRMDYIRRTMPDGVPHIPCRMLPRRRLITTATASDQRLNLYQCVSRRAPRRTSIPRCYT